MRVTDLTKQNSILRNIANNSTRMQTLQDNMASGKRISKISDDPVGATMAQDFRTRISYFSTLQGNLQTNFVWMDRTEAELTLMSELLQRAKTLALSQASDTADANTRRVTGQEVGSIIDAMYNAGNAKIGKLFVFSGTKTFTQPLTRNNIVQPALARFEQQAGQAQFARFEGNSTNRYILRITKSGELGRAHYVVSDDGGASWSRERTLLPQNEIFNPEGLPSDKVRLLLNETSGQVDEQGNPQPLILPAGMELYYQPNPPVEFNGNDEKRMVETGEGTLMPLNVTGTDFLFEQPGKPETVDVFNLLFGVKEALLDNDRDALETKLDDIDQAAQQILSARASIGAVRKEMEDRMEKLNEREYSKVSQLSEIEDLDFAEAVVDLNMSDARHKASLDTSARLIQPSLLNFLR